MLIHLISDTHIEGGDPAELPMVCGDVCVLAGDVCTAREEDLYFEFIIELKKNFDNILMVNGNHELYHMEYIAAMDKMKEIADDAGAHLMDIHYGTDNLEIDGVKFWGSTLWTDLKNNDWFVKQKVGRGLNDYRVIGGLTTTKTYDIHNETVAKINWGADVVITHHMPIVREHSRFPIDDISYGFFCDDLEDKITDSNVKYWLYGHTHDNTHNIIGKTHVLSNQAGYRRETMTTDYDPRFLIEV